MKFITTISYWLGADFTYSLFFHYCLFLSIFCIFIIFLSPLIRFDEPKKSLFRTNDKRYRNLLHKSTLRSNRFYLLGFILFTLQTAIYILQGDVAFGVSWSSLFLLLAFLIYKLRLKIYFNFYKVFLISLLVSFLYHLVLFKIGQINNYAIIPMLIIVISFSTIMALYSMIYGMHIVNTSGEANALVYTPGLIKDIDKFLKQYINSRVEVIVGPIITINPDTQSYPSIIELLKHKTFSLYKFHKRLKLHFIANNKGGFGTEKEHAPGQKKRIAVNSHGDFFASTILLIRFKLTLVCGWIINKLGIYKSLGYTKITKSNAVEEIRFASLEDLKYVCRKMQKDSGVSVETYTEDTIIESFKKYRKTLYKLDQDFFEKI